MLHLYTHSVRTGTATFLCPECEQSPAWTGLPEAPGATLIAELSCAHSFECPSPRAPSEGSQSPWGVVDAATPHRSGAVFVSTPSHGGFWVPPALRSLIPGQSCAWFEEDCAAHLVPAHLPGFTPEEQERALEGCMRWDLLP